MTTEQRQKYSAYLKSDAWKAKRAAVIFRDQGRCQAEKNGAKCGKRHKIEVHHLTYQRFGNEKLSDLVCLCAGCHKAEHVNNR